MQGALWAESAPRGLTSRENRRESTLSWQSGQSVASLRASRRANQSSDDMSVSLASLPSHRRLWARFSMCCSTGLKWINSAQAPCGRGSRQGSARTSHTPQGWAHV